MSRTPRATRQPSTALGYSGVKPAVRSPRVSPEPSTYEISGAGRIDYQFNDAYTGGTVGDPHPVVFILSINLSSH